jgi:hypothetical protein
LSLREKVVLKQICIQVVVAQISQQHFSAWQT